MNRDIVKRTLQVVLTLILQGALVFVSLETITWGWAWIFLSVCIIILIINFLVLPPDVIAERGKRKENVKGWDKALAVISILPFLGTYIVAGMDHRYVWTSGFHETSI